MNARDAESTLLKQCTAIARQLVCMASNQREANVFRLAAMVIHSRLPNEAKHLMQASEQYFAIHPDVGAKRITIKHGAV